MIENTIIWPAAGLHLAPAGARRRGRRRRAAGEGLVPAQAEQTASTFE